MKKLHLFSCLIVLFLLGNSGLSTALYAQVKEQSDTTKARTRDSISRRTVRIVTEVFGVEDYDQQKERPKYPRLFGGLTFTRIDWGFSRLIDDGKFSLSQDNRFLAYSRASNFGFDVLQIGLRTNDHFKVYLAAGFEWNYLRLKENILLVENAPELSYSRVDPNEVNYRKNVLTSTYLRLPIAMEWRSAQNSRGGRVKVAVGAMTGILLKGTQRLVSKENGAQKFRDNFNLSSFQYGPFVRIGYEEIAMFAKYYVNDMFENSPAQKGLNNFTFGLTLGF